MTEPGWAHPGPVQPEEVDTVDEMKIHALLDQLEQEINTEMMVMVRLDIHDLQQRLHKVLESLTTLDPRQIDDVVNTTLLALCSGELVEELLEDVEE